MFVELTLTNLGEHQVHDRREEREEQVHARDILVKVDHMRRERSAVVRARLDRPVARILVRQKCRLEVPQRLGARTGRKQNQDNRAAS